MKRMLSSALAAIALGAFSATVGAYGVYSPPQTGSSSANGAPTMTADQYSDALAQCDTMSGGAREVCLDEARAGYAGQPIPDEAMNPDRAPSTETQGAD
jgi:hypothetical protein